MERAGRESNRKAFCSDLLIFLNHNKIIPKEYFWNLNAMHQLQLFPFDMNQRIGSSEGFWGYFTPNLSHRGVYRT